MLISVILAWVATICAVLTAVKIFTKRYKTLNRFFRKIHIPCGIILLTAGLIHGLMAGNPLGSSITDISVGSVFFTFNFGTLSFIISILLGLSYAVRKLFKNTKIKWVGVHHILTGMLVVTVIVHIIQVGISLPNAVTKTLSGSNNSSAISNSQESSDNGNDNAISGSFSGATLKDGTYEGSAEGYKSTIKVSVTVKNGSVTDITVVDENETPKYFDRAQGIIESIVYNQSLDVDAVSGATFSSKGIQEAVKNALQTAVSEGQIESKEIQVNENKRRKGKNNKF